MVRRTPIRHTVRNHIRNGRPVNSYQRGSGARQRNTRQRVVGARRATELVQLKYPITAEVTDSRVTVRHYDYDEKVSRPVAFRMTILTEDSPYGHENEEWIDGALDIFPALDNSIREGYTVKDVNIIRDTYDKHKYLIKISLKRGVEEVETKEHEAAYMRKIAEETLPDCVGNEE